MISEKAETAEVLQALAMDNCTHVSNSPETSGKVRELLEAVAM